MRRSLVIFGALAVLVSLTGLAIAARIQCDGGRCEGTDRPDQIRGSEERDAIFALGNRDQVDGFGGPDDLHGGDGGDDLCGQEGADWYGGSTQGDLMLEQEGLCTGGQELGAAGNGPGSGPDEMSGGRGADLAFGGDGGDVIRGDDGADSLGTGENFIPSLIGGNGSDLVAGGERGDSIAGGRGDDVLLGNRGNDFIDSREDGGPLRRGDVTAQGGSPNQDIVDCGPGFDEAVVNRNDEVSNCERVRRGSGSGPFSVSRAVAAFRAR